jgi:hypothetical protein
MMFRGRCTVHLDLVEPREVRITNADAMHGTYVDFLRLATRQEARRLLDPGDSEMVSLAPGAVEIALGLGAILEEA